MKKVWKSFLDVIWPLRCINCGRSGSYLCPDCFSLIEINVCQYQLRRETGLLDGLYSAAPYKNRIVQKAISLCKYSCVKELSLTLSLLIISHFQIINKQARDFSGFILCPVPLHKARHKKRGFNQSEEMAKYLSLYLNVPINNFLIRIKNTPPQTTLGREDREINVSGAFNVSPVFKEKIRGAKILLIDDVFTTGATLEECAKVLKEKGAREVWGAVAAQG
jgi:competence protein ComFC